MMEISTCTGYWRDRSSICVQARSLCYVFAQAASVFRWSTELMPIADRYPNYAVEICGAQCVAVLAIAHHTHTRTRIPAAPRRVLCRRSDEPGRTRTQRVILAVASAAVPAAVLAAILAVTVTVTRVLLRAGSKGNRSSIQRGMIAEPPSRWERRWHLRRCLHLPNHE